MTPCYQINIKFADEVTHNVLIKNVTHSPFALRPIGVLLLFRICPQQIAQQALVWNVCRPFYHLEIPVVIQFLTQSAMHAQYFVVDKCCDGQLLEHRHKPLEEFAVFLIIAISQGCF